MPSLVVTREIAEAYRITESTVHRWRRQGKLPFIRLRAKVIGIGATMCFAFWES